MTESLTDPEYVQDIKFSFFYSMFSLWSSGVLVLVCVLSEGVAAFGTVLHTQQFLGLAAAYEVGKVGLAKLLSGHSSSLNFTLPSHSANDNKPIRGPILRKLWIKMTRFLSKLSPLWNIFRMLAILTASWMFLVYITVCFGAPIMSDWYETGSFCLLLTLLTVYPCLLVHGTHVSALTRVWTGSVTSVTCPLHTTCLYTCVGAWLGAVPIPLDWDRDWQVWPISCCLGAVSGHVLGHVIVTCRVWPLMASVNGHGSKRKFI